MTTDGQKKTLTTLTSVTVCVKVNIMNITGYKATTHHKTQQYHCQLGLRYLTLAPSRTVNKMWTLNFQKKLQF